MRRFVDSALVSRDQMMVELEPMELAAADMDAQIDLRPFMDPSPYVVSDLMPLRRVYHYFNVIGVRHLTVIDCREEVVGIITRKDIIAETIEERWIREAQKQRMQRRGSGALMTSAIELAAHEELKQRVKGTGKGARRTGQEGGHMSIKCDADGIVKVVRRRSPIARMKCSSRNSHTEGSSGDSRPTSPMGFRRNRASNDELDDISTVSAAAE
jgi:hypothetical protein